MRCYGFVFLLVVVNNNFSSIVSFTLKSPSQSSLIIHRSRSLSASQLSRQGNTFLLLSATPPPDENEAPDERTSFDQAGRSLIEEEDKKRMEAMGDFDSNPDSGDSAERMRAAIRERAASMNIEKSKVTQEYLKEMSQRAADSRGQTRPGGLDLSQITTKGDANLPGGSKARDWDESLPSMLYNPEDDMTDEEMKEVDKVGQLPVWEQALEELRNAKWPTLGAAGREVIIMAIVVAATGFIIVYWDQFLRGLYTNVGFIPKGEDIVSSFQGLELPAGWTDNMNENDIASFQEDLTKVGSSVEEVTKTLTE